MRACVCIGLAGSNRNITTVMLGDLVFGYYIYIFIRRNSIIRCLDTFVNPSIELFLSKLKIYYDRGALHQHFWNLKYLYLHCISFIKFIFRRVYILKEQKRIIRDP